MDLNAFESFVGVDGKETEEFESIYGRDDSFEVSLIGKS
jgi:hypothetical protein